MSEYYVNITKIIQLNTSRFISVVNIRAFLANSIVQSPGVIIFKVALLNRSRHKLNHVD